MKHIVSVVNASSRNSFESELIYQGETIRISQFGTDFQVDVVKKLIKNFDGKCDAISIGGFHPPVKVGSRQFIHQDSQSILRMSRMTPILDGSLFAGTFIPWALRNEKLGERVFQNRRVAFVSGILQQVLAQTISQYTDRTYYSDPYLHLGVPVILKGKGELDFYTKRMIKTLTNVRLKKINKNLDFSQLSFWRMNEFRDCEYFVGTHTVFDRMQSFEFLKSKTLVLNSCPKNLEERFKKAQVKEIIHFMPEIDLVSQEPRLNYATLEAILQTSKTADQKLSSDDVLNFIAQNNITPKVKTLSKKAPKQVRKFAFVVHPLSMRDLFRHKSIKPLHSAIKPIEKVFEKTISHLPGVKYGSISGIKSHYDGQETEGIIYTLFSTPKEMLSTQPEVTYKKLIKIAEHAASQGCDIMGLGAFTKIVGDAGVTVAHQSPIPVTTGNSLSAASTLWAARLASEKLGFVSHFKKNERMNKKAMVVGATGSIGAVSAKLLSKVVKELVLTGRSGDKLLDLKNSIEQMSPDVEVKIATDSNRYVKDCSLIVVSTSSLNGSILDLSQVSPGAVICDVSRPLSFTPQETVTRTDVLIVESGEILLPGDDIHMTCDIGLGDNVVYACLAETALLSLEGRFESFTLSRDINFEKVNEIYDMAKKHGATLSAIRGPVGLITDQEIALCRHHALNQMTPKNLSEQNHFIPNHQRAERIAKNVENIL